MDRARRVICAEADAVRALADRIDSAFEESVGLLLECRGRVVTTGVGKAGAIARKLAATLSSTGTPALFLHPADGVHGDLGVVTSEDVVIVLSYSGESDEIIRLLPTLKRIGAKSIALVGNVKSSLANAATVVLNVSVESEACPLGLAPTSSSIAMLAMGDALALTAMEARGFTKEDFAAFHPAGALGRRLTLTVADIMRSGDQLAVASKDVPLIDVLSCITRAGAGAACLIDSDGRLSGFITDGDLRRAIQDDIGSLNRPASEVMNASPLAITGNPLAVEALAILEESPRRPGEAPVIDSEGCPVGMIMLKDILRSGIV